MGDFIKDCENMIGHVQFLLKKDVECTTKFPKCNIETPECIIEGAGLSVNHPGCAKIFPNCIGNYPEDFDKNPEWILRYADYAKKINNHMGIIQNLKKNRFHEWAPLHVYMTISEAKGQMKFGLRYLGQDVAKLKVVPGKITISTKGFDETNEKFFNPTESTLKLDSVEWTSADAANFRRHFLNNPIAGKLGKRNEEHRIESMFLTEFAKKRGEGKIIRNIQPVKIAGIARFQMPTPLNASDIKNVRFAGSAGGGIDILSRVGAGGATKLCIMELKDENIPKEPPKKVILQCLAYATFIRELLRSESGQEWWKIFGFIGKLPRQLELYVVSVMPHSKNPDENDRSFADVIIKTGEDSFHLDYIYFHEVDNKLVDIETSLKQCLVQEI